MLRTRKDVWKLTRSASDRTLFWYARAVAEMQKRPIADPTSWRYQAAIHGYDRRFDPFARPEDQLPDENEQRRYWARCQHASWYFLPWHRIYLFYFEQIVLETIKSLGGPDDWALPYWNYSDRSNPRARSLPRAFTSPTLSDGSANPLWVQQRNRSANNNQLVGIPDDADISACLRTPRFTSAIVTGFGGGRSNFIQFGRFPGTCERTPHNTIHVAVGGWMGNPDTAALDPIFWLHHANVDRLWQVWRDRDPSHINPTERDWLSSSNTDYLHFHDANGTPVTLRIEQVVNTEGPVLDYTYQDLSDPLPRARGAVSSPIGRIRTSMVLETAPGGSAAEEPVPEMVGATDTRSAITLGREPTSVELSLQEPSSMELFSTRGAATSESSSESESELFAIERVTDREVYLNIENVTATTQPDDNFLIYVDLPEGANPDDYPELKAGVLPMFGIVKASQADEEHPGDGLNYSYDITDIVSFLEPQGLWNPDNFRVTFVPYHPEAEEEAVPNTQPVKVGRVSLYYL